MEFFASPSRPLRRLLVLLDALLIFASFAASMAERRLLATLVPLRALPSLEFQKAEYILLAVLTVPLWLWLSAKFGVHEALDRAWSPMKLAWRVVQLHGAGFIVIAMLIYAMQAVVNRSLLGLFVVNSLAITFAAYASLSRWRRFQYRRGMARARLLLLGNGSEPMREFLREATRSDFAPTVVGLLADGPQDSEVIAGWESAIPILGTADDLERTLHTEAIDAVLFFPPFDRAERVETALLACEAVGVPAMLAIDLVTRSRSKPYVTRAFGRPFVSFERVRKRADLLALKHLFDFCAATVGIIMLSPVLLGAAIAVWATMGRPILFGQERAGLRGRPFRMLKFRTMTADAEARKGELLARNEMSGPVFKIGDDPRITPLGRWLRKTSIDELPQLFHVMLGTMSLVGPRPLPMSEQQNIRGWHRRRLAMRPGITGLWQVSGRSDVDFDRWMELDLEYVDEWSLWNDAKLLLKTIPAVLSQRGAK